jgi:hypothetical protein
LSSKSSWENELNEINSNKKRDFLIEYICK